MQRVSTRPAKIEAAKRTTVSGEQSAFARPRVERQNLTMHTHMKRLARLTLAFSKKLENFRAATALHFAYYNFVKTHSSIRCTPFDGVSSHLWKVEDLVALT
jgi:hypothetical protein